MQMKKGRQVQWYRSPVDPELLKALSQRSNAWGLAQAMGFLGLYATTAGLAMYGVGRWHPAAVAGMVFLHGTVGAFMINGVHELGHRTVFRTAWLNRWFERVLAFLGWINHEMFNLSHSRHHAYTLHPPDDLEVVLPIKLMAMQFVTRGVVNWPSARWIAQQTWAKAHGRFEGEWELTILPADKLEKRRPVVRWARILLVGHGLIVAASVTLALVTGWPGWWLAPVLTTLTPAYGNWLFWLCNNTQHIGLMDNVPDFRLNCRTFLVNPVVGFLYWRMNYHTEHHMYPTVPCYRLGALHRAIRHDLPPCPRGIVACWREILAILRRQEADPSYQHHPALPKPRSGRAEGQALSPVGT